MFSTNRILVKLYDNGGTFKETLQGTFLSSLPSFSNTLGYGCGDLTFTYSVDYTSTTIQHYDRIQITGRWGKVLYTGVIISLERIGNSKGEGIKVRCNGLNSYLKRTLYEDGASNFNFTVNQDPAQHIKDIIDFVNTKYSSLFSYDATSIVDTGYDVSIEYDYNDCYEALQSVLDTSTYNFYVDPSGKVFFTPKQQLKARQALSGDFLHCGSTHGLDNRSVQTQFFRLRRDSDDTSKYVSGYGGRTTFAILTDGRLYAEIQGSGSRRIYSVNSLELGKRYSIAFQIPQYLTTGVSRQPDDITFFIDWIPQEVTSTATGNNNDINNNFRLATYNGALQNNGGLTYAECRLYDTALSNSEVIDLSNGNYNATAPVLRLPFNDDTLYEVGTAPNVVTNNWLTPISIVLSDPNNTPIVSNKMITYRKDVEELVIWENSNELLNKITVEYGSGLYASAEDTGSQSLYGILEGLIVDEEITNADTAAARAIAALTELATPKLNIKLKINGDYDIENINPGDTIKLLNSKYPIVGYTIHKIDYKVTSAVLYLEWYKTVTRSLSLIGSNG